MAVYMHSQEFLLRLPYLHWSYLGISGAAFWGSWVFLRLPGHLGLEAAL